MRESQKKEVHIETLSSVNVSKLDLTHSHSANQCGISYFTSISLEFLIKQSPMEHQKSIVARNFESRATVDKDSRMVSLSGNVFEKPFYLNIHSSTCLRSYGKQSKLLAKLLCQLFLSNYSNPGDRELFLTLIEHGRCVPTARYTSRNCKDRIERVYRGNCSLSSLSRNVVSPGNR